METLDPFDPNNWGTDEPREYRIYASNDADFYVTVSQEDYSFLAQSEWSIHTFYIRKKTEFRKKFYLRRSVSDFYGPDGEKYINPVTGYLVRNRKRIQRNLFLHFVVMLRKQADGKGEFDPPTKHHHIVDHSDRNTRNCERPNLNWTTPSDSRINQDGYKPKPTPRVKRGYRKRRRRQSR